MQAGQQYGNRIIQDVRGWAPGSQPEKDPTTELWFYLDGHRAWTYHVAGSEDTFDWVVEGVARQVAQEAQFAGEIFGLMLKAGGFGLGLSTSFAAILASEVLTTLGDEGLAAARGEKGRSGWEIPPGGAFDVLIGHFAGRMFGHRDGGLSAEVEGVLDRSVTKARQAVVEADTGEVAQALNGGGAREVEDAGLRSEGYRTEVEIVSDGEAHTWREKPGHGWCRFSDRELCVGSLGTAVDEAAAKRNVRVDLGKAGVSKIAANKVGGALVLDDVIARIPQIESKSTELIRVTKAALPRRRREDHQLGQ